MTLPQYHKPRLTVPEQIKLLEREGLKFSDKDKASHILENVSLYRLKSYLKPFFGSQTFKPEANFDDVYSLYKFDSELRKMICSELEKIEISIRTQLSLIMSDGDDIFWFENPLNFRDIKRHCILLNNLKTELRRSDDEAIVKFLSTYSNRFPPSWMTFEVSSFGTLSMMYRLLKPGHARRNLARFYGLSDSVMESWLHSMVYVRNICAHHSRLWNRRLSINPIIPRRTYRPFITVPHNTEKVYYLLSIILYFLKIVNPNNTFPVRLRTLLNKYPNVDVTAMGFPKGWQEEEFWA